MILRVGEFQETKGIFPMTYTVLIRIHFDCEESSKFQSPIHIIYVGSAPDLWALCDQGKVGIKTLV